MSRRLALLVVLALVAGRAAHAAPSPGYDGKWSELLPTGRRDPAVALDPVHRTLYLYGGYHWTLTEDFYAYDLAAAPGAAAWRRLPTDGLLHPSRLYGSAATWDTRRGRMLLHGGETTGSLDTDELWAYDPATSAWSKIATGPDGPARRAWHSAAYDSLSDVLWLLGGAENSYIPSAPELWALAFASDPPAWRQVVAPGSGPRAGYRPTICVEESPHRLVAVDGFTRPAPDTARVFALALSPDTTWSELAGGEPAPSYGEMHPAVYDAVRRRLLVVPETDASRDRADLFEFGLAGSGWRRIALPGPALLPHEGTRLAYEPATGQVLRAAGVGTSPEGAPEYEADVWRVNPEAGAPWTALGGEAFRTPAPRLREAWALDPAAGRIYLFGGYSATFDGSGSLGDTWSLDLAGGPAWREEVSTADGPGEREGACGAFDTRRRRMLVFGGIASGRLVADVLAYDAAARTWSSLEPTGSAPSARCAATAIYDSLADRVIVHGGDDGHPCADLWALELGGAAPHWRELHPLGTVVPPARSYHSAVFDSKRNAMWVYGGAGESGGQAVLLGDAWRLDLAGDGLWSPADETTHEPPARMQHGAAYDPARDRMVVLWGAVLDGSRRTESHALSFADGPAWRILGLEGINPYPGSEHFCVWDTPRDRLILYGGSDGYHGTVGWVWALEWTPPAPPTEGALAVSRARIRPNPSQGGTAIECTLSAPATVLASIYDLGGRLVRRLGGGVRAAGPVSLGWDGRNEHGVRAPAGVYAVRLEVGETVTQQKLVLLR